jgi:hypothetical protein
MRLFRKQEEYVIRRIEPGTTEFGLLKEKTLTEKIKENPYITYYTKDTIIEEGHLIGLCYTWDPADVYMTRVMLESINEIAEKDVGKLPRVYMVNMDDEGVYENFPRLDIHEVGLRNPFYVRFKNGDPEDFVSGFKARQELCKQLGIPGPEEWLIFNRELQKKESEKYYWDPCGAVWRGIVRLFQKLVKSR